MQLLIKTEFGLEALVKREVQNLGYEDLLVEDGVVMLDGDERDIARLNIYLRTAERVAIVVAAGVVKEFEDLFQLMKRVNWPEFLPPDARFVVNAATRKSKLMSARSMQSVGKKAVLESFKERTGQTAFPESGIDAEIEITVLDDFARILLDTSGDGLYKRGYKTAGGIAPLKETMASALVQLSFWRAGRVLYDPLCGSGTIPIEAAMLARNIAPGGRRRFAAEQFVASNPAVWKEVRAEAEAAKKADLQLEICASDIDENAITMAKQNAERAGVADAISWAKLDIRDFRPKTEDGIIISNLPYGERLGTEEELRIIYKGLVDLLHRRPEYSYYLLTAEEKLEKILGRRADRKRKLYNGRIKVDYYQFYGPKPGNRK